MTGDRRLASHAGQRSKVPAGRFRPVTLDGVRRLPQSDAESVRLFQSSCPPEDWDHGGIDPTAADVWASFEENKIVALGQPRPHSEGAVDPCVITHPDHRGQGHALRLVSAMAQAALSQERLVLYQTLVSNVAALSIARRLGFAQYATLVAVRLARDVRRHLFEWRLASRGRDPWTVDGLRQS